MSAVESILHAPVREKMSCDVCLRSVRICDVEDATTWALIVPFSNKHKSYSRTRAVTVCGSEQCHKIAIEMSARREEIMRTL